MTRFVLAASRGDRPEWLTAQSLTDATAFWWQDDGGDLTPPPAVDLGSNVATVVMQSGLAPSNGTSVPGNTSNSLRLATGDAAIGDPSDSFIDGVAVTASQDRITCQVDLLGSRSLVVYFDDDLFFVSTSQLALLRLLRSSGQADRSPQSSAIAWMLSCGSLGPAGTWDQRLHLVPPGGSITLNRETWSLNEEAGRDPGDPFAPTYDRSGSDLEAVIQDVFRQGREYGSHWTLGLSGGMDSRAVLAYLRASQPIDCFSTGSDQERRVDTSDVAIAKRVAQHFDVPHHTVGNDPGDEPPATVIRRYVAQSEGLIDHITGYVDGFHTFRSLRERGYDGVVRGDKTFAWSKVNFDDEVYRIVGLPYFGMIPGLASRSGCEHLVEAGDPPEWMTRRVGENLTDWRDRMYQYVRVPTALSALTNTKASFVDVTNPLLAPSIIETARRLPPALRNGRDIFKHLPEVATLRIPCSTTDRGTLATHFMQRPGSTAELRRGLESSAAAECLPQSLIAVALSSLDRPRGRDPRQPAKSQVRRLVPKSIWQFAKRRLPPPSVAPQTLALRCYLVSRVRELIAE